MEVASPKIQFKKKFRKVWSGRKRLKKIGQKAASKKLYFTFDLSY